jgi:hypothetical protein
MAYELYDSKAAKFGSPQLTIRSARFAFNAEAGDILSKAGIKFYLLWDSEVCRLALRAAKARTAGASRSPSSRESGVAWPSGWSPPPAATVW